MVGMSTEAGRSVRRLFNDNTGWRWWCRDKGWPCESWATGLNVGSVWRSPGWHPAFSSFSVGQMFITWGRKACRRKYCFHPHFVYEETGHREINLAKITHSRNWYNKDSVTQRLSPELFLTFKEVRLLDCFSILDPFSWSASYIQIIYRKIIVFMLSSMEIYYSWG